MSALDRLALNLLTRLEPETAHGLALKALRWGLVPRPATVDDPVLRTEFCGLGFRNPLGLAAGFDKDAVAVAGLAGLGFGFIEVGTVTPRPQAGNPKPRLFRLGEDGAIINRLGFNNAGLVEAAGRLAALRRTAGVVVGANVGANRESTDRYADYALGVSRLAPLVDFVTINVSSPNTPGLRDLQGDDSLRTLLRAVISARAGTAAPATPLFLKIAPDLSDDEVRTIGRIAVEEGVDGLVATNTTVDRPPSLSSRYRSESGGLSGAPLMPRSTEVLRALYEATEGHIPLIGVGGVASGADAYGKIRAGASLVQIYTAFVFKGPAVVPGILRELAALLRADGFSRVGDAVGADASRHS